MLSSAKVSVKGSALAEDAVGGHAPASPDSIRLLGCEHRQRQESRAAACFVITGGLLFLVFGFSGSAGWGQCWEQVTNQAAYFCLADSVSSWVNKHRNENGVVVLWLFSAFYERS